MSQTSATHSGAIPDHDSLVQLAPDPRARYASPESLAQDSTLDIRQREVLLLEWKYDLEQRLAAVSEGMSASTPDRIPDQTRLSAELRSVTQAWDSVCAEVKRSATIGAAVRS